MNCYNNTLMAGLFYETEVVRLQTKLGALRSVVNDEKSLIVEFLHENGLTAKFYEYSIERKTGVPYMKKE